MQKIAQQKNQNSIPPNLTVFRYLHSYWNESPCLTSVTGRSPGTKLGANAKVYFPA